MNRIWVPTDPIEWLLSVWLIVGAIVVVILVARGDIGDTATVSVSSRTCPSAVAS